MIYEPNTTQWRRGDIVLHDGDAKEPKMFMQVIGYTRDGLCKTQYVDRRRKRTIWKNEIKYLHDPARFGFKGNEKQDDWFKATFWNNRYPVGTEVVVHLDSGVDKQTVTASTAQLLNGGSAVIWLEGVSGCYLLRAVSPVKPRTIEDARAAGHMRQQAISS